MPKTRTTSNVQRSLQMAVVAGCSGLALFATACSNSSGGVEDSGAAGGGSSVSDGGKDVDAALKLRQCLRKHGIDIPDPKPGQDPRGLTLDQGSDPAKFEKAMKKCGSTGRKGGGKMTQADKDKMLKYAQCMRKNGIDMPDPKFEGGGAKGEAMKIPDGKKDQFEKANKLCSQDNG
ncbi:hypothetical protein [Streptomyces sp. NPDC002851]